MHNRSVEDWIATDHADKEWLRLRRSIVLLDWAMALGFIAVLSFIYGAVGG